MGRHLDCRNGIPLEREYEGWIAHQIEIYFKTLGLGCEIRAVSALEESSWPADERLEFDGKIIGLQVKRPHFAKSKKAAYAFEKLHWDLSNTAKKLIYLKKAGVKIKSTRDWQYSSIQNSDEIFYCLPTFTNREWRGRALDHCLFWRPGTDMKHKGKVNPWFDAPPIASNPYRKISQRVSTSAMDYKSYRWGELIERTISCEWGVPFDSKSTLPFVHFMREVKSKILGISQRSLPDRQSSILSMI